MRKIGSILCAFLLLVCVIVPANAASYLIPGGQCVGLHLQDDTLFVAAIDETLGEAARAAGLKVGDRLVGVNGQAVKNTHDVKNALRGCEKAEVSILRNGKPYTGMPYFANHTKGVVAFYYWLNPEIIDFLNQVLKTEGFEPRLHAVSDAYDQMVFLICGSEKEAAGLRSLLGTEPWESNAGFNLLDWLGSWFE